MEQPERADVAGLIDGPAGRTRFIRSARRRMPARSRDHEVAANPEQRAIDAVAFARVAPDVEGPHGRSIARGPCRERGDPGQPATASTGRLAVTCSIARRRSSSPDGSNS